MCVCVCVRMRQKQMGSGGRKKGYEVVKCVGIAVSEPNASLSPFTDFHVSVSFPPSFLLPLFLLFL